MNPRSAGLALGFSSVGHFFAHLLMLLYPTVLLVLEGRWGMSYGDLLSLSLGGFVLFGLGALPAGWLGDRWSAEGMMVVFFIGTGGAAIVTGLTDGPVALALGLAAIGLFGSIYHPVGTAWLVRNARNRGRALGINGIAGSIGLAAGAFVAGALTQAIGWRAAFIIPGTLCAATGAVLLCCMRGGSVLAAAAGGRLADRFPMKAVYVLAWAAQVPLFVIATQARNVPLLGAMIAVNYLGVLSVPAENALLARYSPPQWRATAFGAKFLLALGVSTIGVKLVAVIYDGAGNFAPLWLTLAGCAGFVAAAGLFLPGRLRRTTPIFTPQPAE